MGDVYTEFGVQWNPTSLCIGVWDMVMMWSEVCYLDPGGKQVVQGFCRSAGNFITFLGTFISLIFKVMVKLGLLEDLLYQPFQAGLWAQNPCIVLEIEE